MVHLLFLMKRKPGLSRQECQRHWRGIHAPLAQRIPGIRRYVQSHVFSVEEVEPLYDGVAQIWFADLRAMQEMLESKAYVEETRPDGAKFIAPAGSVTLLAEENRVIWPE